MDEMANFSTDSRTKMNMNEPRVKIAKNLMPMLLDYACITPTNRHCSVCLPSTALPVGLVNLGYELKTVRNNGRIIFFGTFENLSCRLEAHPARKSTV